MRKQAQAAEEAKKIQRKLEKEEKDAAKADASKQRKLAQQEKQTLAKEERETKQASAQADYKAKVEANKTKQAEKEAQRESKLAAAAEKNQERAQKRAAEREATKIAQAEARAAYAAEMEERKQVRLIKEQAVQQRHEEVRKKNEASRAAAAVGRAEAAAQAKLAQEEHAAAMAAHKEAIAAGKLEFAKKLELAAERTAARRDQLKAEQEKKKQEHTTAQAEVAAQRQLRREERVAKEKELDERRAKAAANNEARREEAKKQRAKEQVAYLEAQEERKRLAAEHKAAVAAGQADKIVRIAEAQAKAEERAEERRVARDEANDRARQATEELRDQRAARQKEREEKEVARKKRGEDANIEIARRREQAKKEAEAAKMHAKEAKIAQDEAKKARSLAREEAKAGRAAAAAEAKADAAEKKAAAAVISAARAAAEEAEGIASRKQAEEEEAEEQEHERLREEVAAAESAAADAVLAAAEQEEAEENDGSSVWVTETVAKEKSSSSAPIAKAAPLPLPPPLAAGEVPPTCASAQASVEAAASACPLPVRVDWSRMVADPFCVGLRETALTKYVKKENAEELADKVVIKHAESIATKLCIFFLTGRKMFLHMLAEEDQALSEKVTAKCSSIAFCFDAARLSKLPEKQRYVKGTWGIEMDVDSGTMFVVVDPAMAHKPAGFTEANLNLVLDSVFNFIGASKLRYWKGRADYGAKLPGTFIGPGCKSGFIFDESFMESKEYKAWSYQDKVKNCTRMGKVMIKSCANGIEKLVKKGATESDLVASKLKQVVVKIDPTDQQNLENICSVARRTALIFSIQFVPFQGGMSMEVLVNLKDVNNDINAADILAALDQVFDTALVAAQENETKKCAEWSSQLRQKSGSNRPLSIRMDWSFVDRLNEMEKAGEEVPLLMSSAQKKSECYKRLVDSNMSRYLIKGSGDFLTSIVDPAGPYPEAASLFRDVVEEIRFSMDVTNSIRTKFSKDGVAHDGAACQTQCTMEDGDRVCSIQCNMNTWNSSSGWGRAGTCLGPLFTFHQLRRTLLADVEAASSELGIKIEVDMNDFIQDDSYLVKSDAICRHIMHRLSGGRKGDVLDSIVQALKSIVMAHPASSAALNDQVDTIIICSLESSHYSTDHQNGVACHALCNPAQHIVYDANKRALVFGFSLDNLATEVVPSRNEPQQDHWGKPCPFKEWAVEVEWRLGCTLDKAQACGEKKLEGMRDQLALKTTAACTFELDWTLMYSHDRFAQVVQRKGDPRFCLDTVDRIEKGLFQSRLLDAMQNYVAATPVGIAAFGAEKNRVCKVAFQLDHIEKEGTLEGANVSKDLVICIFGLQNLDIASNLASVKWGNRMEHAVNILESKCRHLVGNKCIAQAKSTLENRLERDCPINIDSTSFLNESEFLALTPWNQYAALTTLLCDVPDLVLAHKSRGLMAMAIHDCGKSRLNGEEKDVEGGVKVRVDVTNSQKETNGTSLSLDPSDSTLCITINLTTLCTGTESVPTPGGCQINKRFINNSGEDFFEKVKITIEPHEHALVKIGKESGRFMQDWRCSGCQKIFYPNGHNHVFRYRCGSGCDFDYCQSCKDISEVVTEFSPIQKISDWQSRIFLLFDMVVTLARFGCKEETTRICDKVSSSFGGAMPVEINWGSFVKSQQFLALPAGEQTNVATVAATTMLDSCLLGESAFANTGVGLCFFPAAVEHMKGCFDKILFHVDPASSLENSSSVSLEGNSLNVHMNLTSLTDVAASSNASSSHFMPLRTRCEAALAPGLRTARQAAVVEESQAFLAKKIQGLPLLPADVSMDFSFLDRAPLKSDTEYVTKTRECAQQAAAMLCCDGGSYAKQSLHLLATRTPELKQALEQRVKRIVLLVDEQNSSEWFVSKEVDDGTLQLMFNLKDRRSNAGAGRSVLQCLCPSVSADHHSKHTARSNVVSKWLSQISSDQQQMKRKQQEKVDPLKKQIDDLKRQAGKDSEPVKRTIKDKKSEEREKVRELEKEIGNTRERLKKEWLENWKRSIPSCVKSKHSTVCNSGSDWYVCTSCNHAWCTHSKCGHTGGNCPSCSRGHGKKPNSQPSPPQGAIDKEKKEQEGKCKDQIKQIKDSTSSALKGSEDQLKEIEKNCRERVRDLDEKLNSLDRETSQMNRDIDEKLRAKGTKELNGMATPGGVAYTSL